MSEYHTTHKKKEQAFLISFSNSCSERKGEKGPSRKSERFLILSPGCLKIIPLANKLIEFPVSGML